MTFVLWLNQSTKSVLGVGLDEFLCIPKFRDVTFVICNRSVKPSPNLCNSFLGPICLRCEGSTKSGKTRDKMKETIGLYKSCLQLYLFSVFWAFKRHVLAFTTNDILVLVFKSFASVTSLGFSQTFSESYKVWSVF